MKDPYPYVADEARKAQDHIPVVKGITQQALLLDFTLRQKISH